MRIEQTPVRAGSLNHSLVTIEWAGRTGHPSSYGLLSGTEAETCRVEVAAERGRFRDALAPSSHDEVFWGLPAEYESAVVSVLHEAQPPLLVAGAAHGLVGSSQHVFAALTRLLRRLLVDGIPADEDALWQLRDACWTD